MAATISFYGHACFGVELQGDHICIDPYRSGGFNGLVALPPLPDHFTAVACTHWHDDHAAVDTIPGARPIVPGDSGAGWSLRAVTAAHDEHGGALRGGLIQMLVLSTCAGHIVHCGDLGQLPTPALLASLREATGGARIDVLIIPVGGHFTLGGDGAAAWVEALRPAAVVPCHSADDGTLFSELAPRRNFLNRFAVFETQTTIELPLRDYKVAASQVVVLEKWQPSVGGSS